MGKILPSYKKILLDNIIEGINANTDNYYAVASNPVPYSVSPAPTVKGGDYNTYFYNDWSMIFGKKLYAGDFAPMIKKIEWTSNTVYDIYDNNDEFLYEYDKNFYVICPPEIAGGSYNIFKCIDNANGAASTVKPTLTQETTFQTSPDNYKWRYITSISTRTYNKFSNDDYVPVFPNTEIVAVSKAYSGVEVIKIANSGSGYSTYHSGNVVNAVDSKLIQIQNDASPYNDFYTKSSIYIYNISSSTSQLFDITGYVSNNFGKFVYLNTEANTENIISNSTKYIISPKVSIISDGDVNPSAYCTINTTSNSIQSIVILDAGSDISRANVSIVANSSFGSGANLYAIVPPPGGHGSDPATELNMKGIGVGFFFANTERSTIITSNVNYNKISLIKNPYRLDANGYKTANLYTTNTFNQYFSANISPSVTFNTGDTISGVTSNAVGIVVFSNSSVVYFTGDKNFVDGEYITSSNGQVNTAISINTRGSIYAKDLKPLYVQNINNVNRSNTSTESFKLIIQI